MNNLLKYGIGLAALGLTVYVAGVAWRRSQKTKNGGTAGFSSIGGNDDGFASMSHLEMARRPKGVLRSSDEPLSRIRRRR